MEAIYHYTVATGDGRWSPRSEVADDAIHHIQVALYRLAIAHEDEDLGPDDPLPVAELGDGWQIQIPMLGEAGGWCFAVGRHGEELARCWLLCTAEQAAEHWPNVVASGDTEFALPVAACPALPCLAVVVHEDAASDRETWLAIGDLERCIAWALIDARPT